MDHQRFDGLVREFGMGATRRRAMGLLAGSLGTVVTFRAAEEAAAKKKRKRPSPPCVAPPPPPPAGPPPCNAKPAQASCDSSAECCPGRTSRICGQNYCTESNEPVCCGGIDAPCETHCDCCGDLICGIHGQCVY